jgi:hypothetical protein
MNFKNTIFGLMVLCTTIFTTYNLAAEVAVKELKVTREELDNGKSIFTVFSLPGETRKYDRVDYILKYHQSFLFNDSRGRKYRKKHEPAEFKYSRKRVKFVEDLDNYVNFMVPVSRERLKIIYGKLTFHPNYQITIPEVIIRAYDDGDVAWELVVKVNKEYVWDEKTEKLILKPSKKKPVGKK